MSTVRKRERGREREGEGGGRKEGGRTRLTKISSQMLCNIKPPFSYNIIATRQYLITSATISIAAKGVEISYPA